MSKGRYLVCTPLLGGNKTHHFSHAGPLFLPNLVSLPQLYRSVPSVAEDTWMDFFFVLPYRFGICHPLRPHVGNDVSKDRFYCSLFIGYALGFTNNTLVVTFIRTKTRYSVIHTWHWCKHFLETHHSINKLSQNSP